MQIIPYTPDLRNDWDAAVDASRNGIFQHRRDYMDYHSDRFDDCSLMAANDRGTIVAVLPAHRRGDIVSSHRGLTFGGWLMTPKADVTAMLEVWQLMARHYADAGARQLYYRPAPHIYHSYPAEEDLYAIFRAGARLEGSQVSSVVDLDAPLGFDMAGRQALRKAAANGLTVAESDDFDTFWQMLADLLRERHNATPVHTLDEIKLLRSRFPENIRLYMAYSEGIPVAGVVIYYTRTAAHSQYTATTDTGRRLRALPPLYDMIMEQTRARGIRWMDFGTSCLEGGRVLNEGLVRQKCGYGGRAIVYNAYSIDL